MTNQLDIYLCHSSGHSKGDVRYALILDSYIFTVATQCNSSFPSKQSITPSHILVKCTHDRENIESKVDCNHMFFYGSCDNSFDYKYDYIATHHFQLHNLTHRHKYIHYVNNFYHCIDINLNFYNFVAKMSICVE